MKKAVKAKPGVTSEAKSHIAGGLPFNLFFPPQAAAFPLSIKALTVPPKKGALWQSHFLWFGQPWQPEILFTKNLNHPLPWSLSRERCLGMCVLVA